MKKARRRIDVNLEELDRVLDGAREAPLSDSDHDKLKHALHALAAMLVQPRNTEKISAVVGKQEDPQSGTQPDTNTPPPLATAVMEQRRLVVRGRLTSGTRR